MSKDKNRKKNIYDVWPKKDAFKSWRPEISIRNGIHVNKSIMEGDNWYVAIKNISYHCRAGNRHFCTIQLLVGWFC